MKKITAAIFILFAGQVLTAQDFLPGLIHEKNCSRVRNLSRIQNIQYLQYPAMSKYDVKFLRLDLNIEPANRFFSGNAYMESLVLSDLDSFAVELKENMNVDSVLINSTQVSFDHVNDHVIVKFSTPLPAGSMVRSQIFYKGNTGSGIYAGTTGSLNYTATLSESYQAREWWPAKQILTDKIDSTEIWITTSIGNRGGSNGLLIDSIDVGGGKRQFRWKTRYPMNYYLPSIAVGNYREYRNYAKPQQIAPDSILIQHFISPASTYLSSNKTNIDKTPVFIEKCSELFGLYPFSDEKYGHCQASIGGGMEHQTMSTMQNFGTSLIAHELVHQWFGDNVTCATWNHIWVNEGFATYGEYLMAEFLPALYPTTTAANIMQNVHNNVMSQPGGSVFVPDASLYDENRIFNFRLSYNKGSAILHNLRFEMGSDAAFFNALKNFQTQFKDSVATAEDLRFVAEAACGKSLSDFFQQWYYGEGYPTINLTYFRQGNDSLLLLVNQITSAPSVTPFFKGLLEIRINSDQGDTTIVINMASNDQQFKIPYNKTISSITIDPSNRMLNQTGFIVNGGTVPLRFISFESREESNCFINLEWQANNETPGTVYIVEYSSNGTSFSNVAMVQSNGNTSYVTRYQNTQSGPYYYRIRAVEPSGRIIVSDILTGINQCSMAFETNAFPNPFRDEISMNVQMPQNGDFRIEIFNSLGQIVFKKEMTLRAGSNSMKMNTGQLPSGLYYLRSSTGEKQETKKLIKAAE